MSDPAIFEVRELDLTLEDYDWPFARENAAAIAEHWRRRREANPSLFDGRVLLQHRHVIDRSVPGLALRGAYFETAYSNFLAWRDMDFPGDPVCNCFSMAALKSSDGAFLLGEMSRHTTNAGQIYFAAGTPDLNDVFAGRVDLGASVIRELGEETGLRAEATQFAASWIVVHTPPRIACMKLMRLSVKAEVAKASIEAFLAGEVEPELARMHIVRSVEDIDERAMPPFIRAFLRHAL